MRYAVISGGKVTNVIEAPANWTAPEGVQVVPSDTAEIGWSYDGVSLTAPGFTAPPLTAADLVASAKRMQEQVLATGITVNVAASGASAINILADGTNDTRADLALLALYGQANPTGTKTWLDNNGVSTVLTGVELVMLATLIGNWVSATYPVLATVIADIAAGSVTTPAQIVAAPWPTA